MKNKTTAILLALFLGGIGGHKFYLGKVGWGIVYLLFCWTFIPAFVALIELIILITTSEEDFNAKYNNGKSTPVHSDMDSLQKLKKLYEEKVISSEEYEQKRAKYLDRI